MASIDCEIQLEAKWSGKEFKFSLPSSATVLDVKKRLEESTRVQIKRQKLIGLVKGKPPADESTLGSIGVANSCKFMMVGAVESAILPERHEIPDLPDVVDDFEWDFAPEEGTLQNVVENAAKLARRLESVQIQLISPPRPGKKLLVLDLDHTLLDFSNSGRVVEPDMIRPKTISFLEQMYQWYDLVIWSQTSWQWLEYKLDGMGLFTNSKFKLTFVLDRSSMFPVTSRLKDGTDKVHEVKPLEFIWRKFPGVYTAANTIHVDDLSRNFVLNVKNGLKIKAFLKDNRDDIELLLVGRYLELIKGEPDLTQLNHSLWKDYLSKN